MSVLDAPDTPTPLLEPLPIDRRPRTGGRVGAVVVWALAVGVGLLLCVTLAGREVHAAPALLALATLLLPYLYMVALVVSFGVWTAIPDRRIPPLACVLLLVVAGLSWGPGWAARSAPVEGEALTVMSWNVQRLWGGVGDRDRNVACVLAAVEDADPDVLVLLEVSSVDLSDLSEALGLQCVHGTYEGTKSTRHGGLASCVRGDRWQLLGGGPRRFVDGVPWHYVWAEISRGARVLNLLAVHLKPYDLPALNAISSVGGTYRVQGDQAAALLDRVSRFEDPTLVAGDFNSTRDTALHVGLRGHLTDLWERGGFGFGATVLARGRLPLRIDYAYASRDFSVVGADVGTLECSDHAPVIGQVILRE